MNQMKPPYPSSVVAGEQEKEESNTSSATKASQQQQQPITPSTRNSIAILPDHVVARIAAGEVVQRPVSVIKELLENSLDALATEIVVTICGSMQEMSMSDNGRGMSPHDLPLAVLRHATSKLSTVDDLQRLDTFGFRGEALSSVSMVASKLVICSRQESSAVAYTLSFRDGKPLLLDSSSSSSSTTATAIAIPQPTARRVGTTVTVYDLFYNLPLRQNKSSNSASSDYNAILHVIQAYAICVAERGIGLICQKKKSGTNNGNHDNKSSSSSSSSRSSSRNMPHTTTDWNSSMGAVAKLRAALEQSNSNINSNSNNSSGGSASTNNARLLEMQQQATKHVIAMIHGSRIQAHLQHFAWTAPAASSSDSDNKQIGSTAFSSGNDASFLYQCKGYLTLPSFYFQDKNPTNGGGGGGANSKTTSKNTTSTATAPANASMRLILFINQRLVECKPLTRAVEDVYAAFSPNGSSNSNRKLPFLYLHLTVPPHQVDVNVHPSKKLVTLLHLNDVCQHLAAQFRQLLQHAGQAFCQSSSASSSSSDPPSATLSTAKTLSQSCLKPLQQQQQQLDNKRPLAWGEKVQIQNPYQPSKKRQRSTNDSGDGSDNSTVNNTGKQEEQDTAPKKRTSRSSSASSSSGKQDDSSPSLMDAPQPSQTTTAAPLQRKKTPASQLIRTSRSSSQVGALEPFLVTKASLSQQSSTSTTTATATSSQMQRHDDDCPLSKRYNKDNANDASSSAMDLSQPGAFAILASQCQCFNRHLSSASSSSSPFSTQTNPATMIHLPSQALVRPQIVVATKCEYKSIRKLRLEIQRQACPELQRQLRSACFVGVVSRERSLLQVGQDLILLNHYEAARELFYQLALLQFKGGARMANLGNKSTNDDNGSNDNRDDSSAGCQRGGIDIATVIADLVETEDILGRLWHEADDHVVKKTMSTMMNTAGPLRKVSETNRALAEQAAACLLEEADLLKEYFSILIERQHDNTGRRQDGKGRIVLSGMPVLLEGYTPAPHGLSLFLLRLATEVNWKGERQCFHDICSELGAFYATLPLSFLACGGRGSRSDDDVSHYLLPHVRHTIFPAISCLLVPPQSLQTNGHWKTLSKLSKLYKVFERC